MVSISDNCVGCGLCCEDCLPGNLRIEDGKAVFHPKERCMVCGHCIAICPQDAVRISPFGEEQIEAAVSAQEMPSPDQLLRFIRTRRSIRHYQPRQVDRETVARLLEAGRYAPTGGNRQKTRYIVLQEGLESIKEEAWATLNQMAGKALAGEEVPSMYRYYAPMWRESYNLWLEDPKQDLLFLDAPAMLIIESDSLLDAGLAAGYIDLMANTMGLGMLYSGFLMRVLQFNRELAGELDIRDPEQVVCMLLGYPSVQYHRTVPRKEAVIEWK